MAKKRTAKTVTINTPAMEMFDRLYPDLFSLFVERAVVAAINDRNLFDKIFFPEHNANDA